MTLQSMLPASDISHTVKENKRCGRVVQCQLGSIKLGSLGSLVEHLRPRVGKGGNKNETEREREREREMKSIWLG